MLFVFAAIMLIASHPLVAVTRCDQKGNVRGGKSMKTLKSNLSRRGVDNKSIKLDSTSAFVQIAKYFDDHKINITNLSENCEEVIQGLILLPRIVAHTTS